MNIRLAITIIISKIIIKTCRLFKLGGTTLPGKIALKLSPSILDVVSKNFSIILVTGTNGKTTTSRIIGQILEENKVEYIANKSGANLVSGIVTTFMESVDIYGRCNAQTAVLEVDEAAFSILSNHMNPEILVVTNFFRDQLDRFGELSNTINNVRAGSSKFKNTKLVLNGDDSLCASLGSGTNLDVVYYGFDENALTNSDTNENTDAVFCLFCKARYEYSYNVYGHLGGFKCSGCGYKRPLTNITCINVDEQTAEFSKITFSVIEKDSSVENYEARINLPGLYNIYNALGAVTCATVLGLPVNNTIKAMENFQCGFGRMETIYAEDKLIKIILVKNPAGFNQVLNYLSNEDKNIRLAFIINDRIADGTDISWLWDVNIEKLEGIIDKIDGIYTSGIRAEDMAVRLKYAGIDTRNINIIKRCSHLVDTAISDTQPGQNLYIIPTYSALLEVRSILKKRFRLKDFWK